MKSPPSGTATAATLTPAMHHPQLRHRPQLGVGVRVGVGQGCWLLTETTSPVMYDE